MKIGLLHRADVADVHALSGAPYYMVRALEKHVAQVDLIGHEPSPLIRGLELGGLALNRLTWALWKRRVPPDHNRFFSWQLARAFKSRVASGKYDVIFAPLAAAELASWETQTPIVYLSDATWHGILDYYPGATGMYQWARREGDHIELSAMRRASALVFPSSWAADSAKNHYGISPEKIYRIPYGANFAPDDIPARELALQHRSDGTISLLWIGVKWERKGGHIAYECLLSLLRRGIDARLTICGCIPPPQFQHERIDVIPFLSKHDPVQRAELSRLLLGATFLLFPTQAEALGIVTCEASAHGLPVLARDTGGVAGALHDGVNGVLMPPDASGEAYANQVFALFEDKPAYNRLVLQSRDLYESTLNWDAWGLSMKSVFERVIKEKVA